jgi:hypothetical protein
MISGLKISKKYQPYLRIGMCSWKYNSWKGLVYDTEKQYSSCDYEINDRNDGGLVQIPMTIAIRSPVGTKIKCLTIGGDTVAANISRTIDDWSEILGAPQGSFFVGRLVIHMSPKPNPLGRGLSGWSPKKRTRLSADMLGIISCAAEFTTAPILTGGPQSSTVVDRCATYKSIPPIHHGP